jgi:hypothetical protein
MACVGPERERFLDCCHRLRDYELRAVVVEAAVDDVLAHTYRSQMNPQSVIGTSIAIWTDYGVPTVWAGMPVAPQPSSRGSLGGFGGRERSNRVRSAQWWQLLEVSDSDRQKP